MGFDAIAAKSAEQIFERLGFLGTLIHGSEERNVRIVLQRDAQAFGSGTGSFVTETRTEVSFFNSEVPVIFADDELRVGAESFLLKTRVFSDGIVHRWEARPN